MTAAPADVTRTTVCDRMIHPCRAIVDSVLCCGPVVAWPSSVYRASATFHATRPSRMASSIPSRTGVAASSSMSPFPLSVYIGRTPRPDDTRAGRPQCTRYLPPTLSNTPDPEPVHENPTVLISAATFKQSSNRMPSVNDAFSAAFAAANAWFFASAA